MTVQYIINKRWSRLSRGVCPDMTCMANWALNTNKSNISRGKGDNFRLGHCTEDHVRHPRQLETLSGRRVVSAAVGAMHCVAITEDGEVLGWGKNEQGQLGEMTSTNVAEPTLLPAMEGKFIVGASCGPSQVRQGSSLTLCG